MREEPSPGKLGAKLLDSLNLNTILLVIGGAVMYYASNVFLTKEIYYRDQSRLEMTLKDMSEKQSKVYDLLLRREGKP